ncbi:MAG TPA: AAA family ATPase, partial [Actinomycetota bacterium]|nr:AAA family ATPase [Actinomycetota bacterium]
MDKERATASAALGRPDAFHTLAESHREDVLRIRERNRQRRLRFVFVINLLILGYLVRRVMDGRPLEFGLPSFGPDTIIYLPLLLIFLMMGIMAALPLINGRSPHIRFSPEQIGLGFDDVKGIDVVREEVMRTLQIFLAYKSFREDLGGNPRRGILFEGNPGTGKTHMAKAMAAEAGVPFFFVSAPSFQSMWFGMTAFKIRSFFRQLKKAARQEGGAIGFIEEIDAVGGARGGMSSMSPWQQSPWSPDPSVSPMATERMVDSGGGGMVNELLIQLQSFDQPPFWGRVRNWMKDVVNLFLPATAQLKKRKQDYSNVLII